MESFSEVQVDRLLPINGKPHLLAFNQNQFQHWYSVQPQPQSQADWSSYQLVPPLPGDSYVGASALCGGTLTFAVELRAESHLGRVYLMGSTELGEPAMSDDWTYQCLP